MIFGLPVDFDPAYAEKIFEDAQKHVASDTEHSELTVWLHLVAVAAGICPSKDLAVAVTKQLYEVQEKTKAHVMELEDDDFRRTSIDSAH